MSIFNHEIEKIKYVSSYNDLKLQCDILLIYLRINQKWFKVSICDGVSKISLEKKEPQNEGWTYEGMAFEFLVRDYEKINYSSLGKLTQINEYLYKGKKDESCGLLFIFQNGKISITEMNECLSVNLGIENQLLKECTLSSFEISSLI